MSKQNETGALFKSGRDGEGFSEGSFSVYGLGVIRDLRDREPRLQETGTRRGLFMQLKHGLSRRNFLKQGALATALGVASFSGTAEAASGKPGKYATLIDLTKCDGCRNETLPKCVEACRRTSARGSPSPRNRLKTSGLRKLTTIGLRRKTSLIRLTPYNWTTVQRIDVDGSRFFPRRCMHCDNPPCANLCPFGALNKFKDGSVVIHHDLCLGGAKCKAVCHWHIPQRQSGVGLYLKLRPCRGRRSDVQMRPLPRSDRKGRGPCLCGGL